MANSDEESDFEKALEKFITISGPISDEEMERLRNNISNLAEFSMVSEIEVLEFVTRMVDGE